jgi:hypothetical protein
MRNAADSYMKRHRAVYDEDMLHAAPDYPDQVVRQQRFEAAHPEVLIVFLGPAWQAVVPTEAGEDVLTRYELRGLLDVLEQRDW